MTQVDEHVLVADVGGTHIGVAIFAHSGTADSNRSSTKRCSAGRQELPGPAPALSAQTAAVLDPKVTQACIDFAGPVESRPVCAPCPRT